MENEEFDGISILLLSNQPKKYRLVLRQISNMGISCAAVGNIKKALSHIVAHKPTHLFVSVNIPKMNPVKVAKLISTTFNLPVVLYPEDFGYNTTKILKDISWPYIIYSSFSGASAANMLRYMIKEQNGTLEEGETPEGMPAKNRFSPHESHAEPGESKSSASRHQEAGVKSNSKKKKKRSASGNENESLEFQKKKKRRRKKSLEERKEDFYQQNPKKTRKEFSSDEEFESYCDGYSQEESEYLAKTETKSRKRTAENGEEIEEIWDEETETWQENDLYDDGSEFEDAFEDDDDFEDDDEYEGELSSYDDDNSEEFDDDTEEFEDFDEDEEESEIGSGASKNRSKKSSKKKKHKKTSSRSQYGENEIEENDDEEYDDDDDDDDFDLESLVRKSLKARNSDTSGVSSSEESILSSKKSKSRELPGQVQTKESLDSSDQLDNLDNSKDEDFDGGDLGDGDPFGQSLDQEDGSDDFDDSEDIATSKSKNKQSGASGKELQVEEDFSEIEDSDLDSSDDLKKFRKKKKSSKGSMKDGFYEDLEDQILDNKLKKKPEKLSDPEEQEIHKQDLDFNKDKNDGESAVARKSKKSKHSSNLEEGDTTGLDTDSDQDTSLTEESDLVSREELEEFERLDAKESLSQGDTSKNKKVKNAYQIHDIEPKDATRKQGVQDSKLELELDKKSDWNIPTKAELKKKAFSDLYHAVSGALQHISSESEGDSLKPVGDTRSMVVFAARGQYFNGYLALAAGVDNIVTTELCGPFRKKLLSLLKEQGFVLDLVEPFFILTEKFKYDLMMQEIAVFISTIVHQGEQLAVSFIEVEPKMFEAKFDSDKHGNENYFKIELESIPTNTPMDFDMYISFPQNNKFIKYVKEGGIVDEEQIARLKASAIKAFHLESGSIKKWRSQVASEFINDKVLEIEKNKKTG